jgi:hypothetical protein
MHSLVLFTAVLTTLSADPLPPPASTSAPEEERTFEEFVVIRKDGQRIAGRDGALSGARLIGTSALGKPVDVPAEDIKTLYSMHGTMAGPMTLGFAGLGLLTIGGGFLMEAALNFPRAFQDPAFAPVALGVAVAGTALGALVGLIIGSSVTNFRIEPVVVPGKQVSAHFSLTL